MTRDTIRTFLRYAFGTVGLIAAVVLASGLLVPDVVGRLVTHPQLNAINSAIVALLLTYVVFEGGVHDRAIREATDKRIRMFLEAPQFKTAVADSVTRALEMQVAIGFKINSTQEWQALVRSMAGTVTECILSVIHIESLDNLQRLLAAASDNIAKHPKVARDIILTVDYAAPGFPTFAEDLFALTTDTQSEWRALGAEEATLRIGDTTGGLNFTILDHKHWFFSPSDRRDKGMLFRNDPSLADLLERIIRRRWLTSGAAKSPVEARRMYRAKLYGRSATVPS